MEMIYKRTIFCLLLLLGMSLVASGVQAQEEPFIEASVNGDWMAVYGFEPNQTITITIYDYEGAPDPFMTSVTLDGDGNARLERDVLGRNLVVGNVILATDGTTSKELILVSLSVSGVDYDSDTVWGTAETDLPLRVEVGDEQQSYSLPVSLDSNDEWTADFGAVGFNILDHYWIGVIATEEDGDWTLAELRALPYINGNITGDWASVNEFPPNTPMTISVFNELGDEEPKCSGDLTTDLWGSAQLDCWEVGLEAGNVITADDGETLKELLLVQLTLDVFDPEADIIRGTADPGAVVRVDVWVDESNNASLEVMAGDDGNWSADFDGYDILEDAWYAAFIDDEDGDATMAELPPPPPLPFFTANVTGNWISADGFPPDTEVTVDVYEDEFSSELRFSATLTTDEYGSAWFDFWEQGLYPDNYVEVTGAGFTKGLVVQPLTLDVFDPEADIISGTADPGTPVRVDVWVDDTNNASLEVITDIDGNWIADFNTIEPDGYDLLEEAWYAAFIDDEDGDATMAELPPPPPLPWIEANITADWIEVFEFPPSSTVTISAYELPGDEDPKCEETIESFEEGYAHVDCWEAGLEPGDLVVATDGETTKELLLVPLTIDVFDPENSLIEGTAGGEAFVVVNVYNPPPEDTFASLEVQADSDGNWSAEFTDFTMTLDTWYMAYIYDEDGDATIAELTPTPMPFILAWPEWDLVYGIGFPNGVTVDLIIDDDEDPTNPPVYTASGVTGPAPWNPSETLVEFALDGIVDLHHGHTVVLIYEDVVKVHVVTVLKVVTVRPYVDRIIGIAEPFSGVDIWVQEDPEISISVEAGQYGVWVADFSGVYDIRYDTLGIAAQFDEDGDATFIEWSWSTRGWWWGRYWKWIAPDHWYENYRTISRHGWRSPSHECSEAGSFSGSTDCGSSSAEWRDREYSGSERRLRIDSSGKHWPTTYNLKGDG
jgi:hypothetical protein